jgi:hypothetical protein
MPAPERSSSKEVRPPQCLGLGKPCEVLEGLGLFIGTAAC